jgi:outer membrane biosynthesis protein TonB
MKALCSMLLVSALASGCVRARANTTPDAPLDVPEPPPRDVAPNGVETPPPVPLVAEPAHTVLPRPRPAAPREQPRPPEPKPEPAKPEPAVEPVAEVPKTTDEPAKAPTTLQTTPATAEGEVERGIRASLIRATADLNRIDYRVLNADARTQYDTAKRFIRQANDAIRSKNLLFAKSLADKAAALAAQLAGR